MKFLYATICTLAACCAAFAAIGLMLHFLHQITYSLPTLTFLALSGVTNVSLIIFAANKLEELEAEDLDCYSKTANYKN